MTETTVDIDIVLVRCGSVLGGCELVADRSMPHGEALVLEIEDRRGVRWIAKQVRRESNYRQELAAYREWVRAPSAAAPTLHSAHDDLHLLLMSRLPGEPAEDTPAAHDPLVHRRFGALTRLLHDSAPPVQETGFADRLRTRLEKYIARGDGLLTTPEVEFARSQIARLPTSPATLMVPCHMDNQPRNWIIGEHGECGVIDFGHAERQPWIVDVNRLCTRQWRGKPELADAFFAGYGREPSEDDRRLLAAYLVFAALSTIVWATEHDDSAFAAEGRHWLQEMINAGPPR